MIIKTQLKNDKNNIRFVRNNDFYEVYNQCIVSKEEYYIGIIFKDDDGIFFRQSLDEELFERIDWNYGAGDLLSISEFMSNLDENMEIKK